MYMAEKKITKREMYEKIKARLTDKAEIAFIDHELELLAKKNASKSSKPTKRQAENEGIKDAILEAMEDNVGYQVGSIVKLVAEVADLSNQRVSALMKQLLADEKVKREEIKRVAYYTKI